METKKLYGWYSVQQAKAIGAVLYKTPDGKEVECTSITSKPEHGTKWDDIAFIGEVVSFVRKIKLGDLDEDEKGLSEEELLIRSVKRIPRLEALFNKSKNNQYRWN